MTLLTLRWSGVGLLKLFGSACRSEPAETLSKFDRFASYVFSALDSDVDASVVGVAVETIGFIGSTSPGKRALEQQGLNFAVFSVFDTH